MLTPRQKRLRRMFYAIEVNLILWMAAAGSAFAPSSSPDGPWSASQIMTLVGVAFAAIAQHWAYYSLYRASAQPDER